MSEVAAAGGGGLSSLDVSKACATLPQVQVQALVKKPIGKEVDAPETCGWSGTDLQVQLFTDDADKLHYNLFSHPSDHPITGIGDVARWSEPLAGMTLPDVNVHKGKVTCKVVSVSNVAGSTIAYTGSDPFFTITATAATAYALKEAALCTVLFTTVNA